MSPQIRTRDARSRAAYAASIGPAARAVVMAVAESSKPLQAVATRPAVHAADPRAALAAAVQLRQAQQQVDRALATYLAWCLVGGITRSAVARALGIRPASLDRLLAPVADLAAARGEDLNQGGDGSWKANRMGFGAEGAAR